MKCGVEKGKTDWARRVGFGWLFFMVFASSDPALVHGQQSSPSAPATARKSSLPEAALLKAREAEKQLAANAPDKAIEILQDLDKQYPNQPAISLRLAQINDTLNRNGYALFYYRRYVSEAGPRARSLAVERVSSLELMAGINAQVEKVEKEFGVQTRPVATPVARVERMLATKAKDGGLVPIRSEKDVEKLEREGIPEKSPLTPIPTLAVTPIILPDSRPTPAPSAGTAIQDAATPVQAQVAPSTAPQPRSAAAQEKKADEDALLAQAFLRSDAKNEDLTNDKTASGGLQITAKQLSPSVSGQLELPPVQSEASAGAPAANNSATPPVPPLPRLTPARKPDVVAFTKATPAFETARAASFFNVTPATGKFALVSFVNDVPLSIVTVTITPRDDGEVVSAILASKEQKRVYVKPGTYDVSANVSTLDYSPITLMNTNFPYSFKAGQQYTRRFNKLNVQQLY